MSLSGFKLLDLSSLRDTDFQNLTLSFKFSALCTAVNGDLILQGQTLTILHHSYKKMSNCLEFCFFVFYNRDKTGNMSQKFFFFHIQGSQPEKAKTPQPTPSFRILACKSVYSIMTLAFVMIINNQWHQDVSKVQLPPMR